MTWRRATAWLTTLALALTGCGKPRYEDRPQLPREELGFEQLYGEHCAACHRPGEVAPFSLLDYRDVQKRAAQIVRVTARRYMPPGLSRRP